MAIVVKKIMAGVIDTPADIGVVVPPPLKSARLLLLAGLMADIVPVGSKVLELWCDGGGLVSKLPIGVSYKGLDTDMQSIAQAKTKHPDFDFELVNVLDKLPKGFDYVIARNVVQHVANNSASLVKFANLISGSARFGLIVELSSPRLDTILAFCQRPKSSSILKVKGDTQELLYFQIG